MARTLILERRATSSTSSRFHLTKTTRIWKWLFHRTVTALSFHPMTRRRTMTRKTKAETDDEQLRIIHDTFNLNSTFE
jgi:hypothetical protein